MVLPRSSLQPSHLQEGLDVVERHCNRSGQFQTNTDHCADKSAPACFEGISALLPDEKLALRHVAGAVAGFAGTVLLVTRSADLSLDSAHALGYGAAVMSAIIWAGYSLASSRQLNVATDAVGGFCLGTAVLAAIAHLAFERTVVPEPAEWLAVVALGAGPVGGAFFLWDYGIKRGSVRTLGAVGYLAPLISTVLLIAVAGEPASIYTVAGGLLIVGGAVLAGGEILRRRTT